jgi:hypothetical protein
VSGNAIYLLTIWAIPVIIAITFNGSLAIFAVYLGRNTEHGTLHFV